MEMMMVPGYPES
jgi:hypothetical protein